MARSIPVAVALAFFVMASVTSLSAEGSAPSEPPVSALMDGPYNVFFDANSAELSQDAAPIIDQAAALARSARARGASRIVIVGHTDAYHPDPYCDELSEQRAEAVRRALEDKGIDPEMISVMGKGKSDPLVRTPDGFREAQNRRATIVFQ